MNIYRFLTASLTMLAIASCNEKMVTENVEGAGYITVTSQVRPNTKAGYEISTFPDEFIMDVNQGSAEYNYSLLKMKRINSTLNGYEADNVKPIWASNNHSSAIVKAMTMPSGVALLNSDNTVNITISNDQTTAENLTKNDILGAMTGRNIAISGDAVNIAFDHLMTKLHVVYEIADVTVDYIKLKNVCMGGTYSYADMTYGNANSVVASNEINMHLNTETNTAEAMFYPYIATSDPKIVVKLAGVANELEYTIDVTNGFSFVGGKLYVKNIAISSNGITANDEWIKNVPGGQILWIGTSIPAGSGSNNYPQMIANSTGLDIVNNAVGGSVVLPADPTWVSGIEAGSQSWNFLYAGGLSQSHAEAEARYAISLNGGKITSAQLTEIKALSYDSLIIPYIDGTIDDCQTIIIDHGFNDIQRMILESGGFNAFVSDTDNYAWGDNYFSQLYSGDRTYAQYCDDVMVLDTNPAMGTIKENSYLMAMHKILEKVKSVSPNIKVIIGNYFSTNSPYVNASLGNIFDDYKLTKVLLNYNKAIAAIAKREMGLDTDIVNVYEHIGVISDWSVFCPDGVHPSSDPTGKSNRMIADVYLQELKRIFSSPATKSSANSYDYGWEDVEIL